MVLVQPFILEWLLSLGPQEPLLLSLVSPRLSFLDLRI
jgi:hypothetical protein